MSFMGSKPVGNLKSCIRSRPPLVLFSLCLASISLVTTSLAVYFKFDGNLKNPDALSLNDLGRRLNRLDFCHTPAESSNMPVDSTFLSKSLRYEANVPVRLLPNITYWTLLNAGDLGLDGSQNVSVHFTVEEAGNQHVCVTFIYPPVLRFPETNGTLPCSATVYASTTSIVHLQKMESELEPEPSRVHCNETDVVRFQLKEDKEWDIMLTEGDKEVIYIRLLAMSAFLVAVFLLLLCFALLRGGLPSGSSSTCQHDDDFDRVPLTS